MHNSNLPSHRHNQNLGIIPIYFVVLSFPHDNIVWIHLCNECVKSNVLNVCRMLSSISSKLVYWPQKYHVYQLEPNTDISGQFVHILLIILQQILCLLLWIDGRQYMELRLCVTVRFVCEFAISFHAFLVNRTACHIACTDVNTVSTQRIALICCTLTRGSRCAFHKIFVPSLVPRHVSRPAVHPALWPHIHSSLLLFRSPAQAQGWSRPENTAPIHEDSEVTNLRIQNLAHFFAWPSVSQDHEEMCASDFSK